MRTRQYKAAIFAALLFLVCGTSSASLVSRLGGQAYYDTDLNITWLADANYAATNTFGVSGFNTNGNGDWNAAEAWIAAMNAANYLGVNNWRQPTTVQPDASCDYQQSLSVSYGYSCTGSEMGHMFSLELGGVAHQPIATTHNASYSLFQNVQPVYWSGTARDTSQAWAFAFGDGYQFYVIKSDGQNAWAVSPGDLAVPVPAAVWLFGSALGGLGLAAKRPRRHTSV